MNDIQAMVQACYDQHQTMWDEDDSMDGPAADFAEAMRLLDHMDGVITDQELADLYAAWLRTHTL